jgi:hypothetical protein
MTLTYEDNVPMNLWGKDHWTTLAYIETVMVDTGGFQIGRDSRMRANRRNFRVMAEQCPDPKRVSQGQGRLAVVMDRDAHATRLNDGTTISNHDDWCCVQDMAEVGLFTLRQDQIEPGEILHLSSLGREVITKLREHKAVGGKFADFRFNPTLTPAV